MLYLLIPEYSVTLVTNSFFFTIFTFYKLIIAKMLLSRWIYKEKFTESKMKAKNWVVFQDWTQREVNIDSYVSW